MANRKPFSYPRFQAFDGNGDPLSGGSAEFFDAGTTNNRTVYSDPELNTATPNPVTLNARGEPESGGGTPIDIYFDSSAYKIVLKDSDGNTVWTIDNFIQDDLSDISEPKDPKNATDTGTDTFEGTLNRDPNSGEEFDLDFQSTNTTTTPTFENTGGSLGALTIKTRDGSALWAGALEGIHTLKYDGTDYLLRDPALNSGAEYAAAMDQGVATSDSPVFDSPVFSELIVNGQLKEDPEHATDSGTDTFDSATNTSPSGNGKTIVRDFQSANTTTTPTLDSLTITTKDGSALWADALSGVHTLQLASDGNSWLVLDPNRAFHDEDDMASDDPNGVASQQSVIRFSQKLRYNSILAIDDLYEVDSALADNDGIDIGDIDGDGNTDIAASGGVNGDVYWYEQGADAKTWTKHTVDDNSGAANTELEGTAIGEFAGDGNKYIVVTDQTDGEVILYTHGGDPTGTWTRTVLQASRPKPQGVRAFDIDGDGQDEIVYAFEGQSAGVGGVHWLKYDGGGLDNAANWTDNTMIQRDGAWRILHGGLRDLLNDGNTDKLVYTARNNENPSADPGVFYLTKPATVTDPWTETTVGTSLTDPLNIAIGDFFGDETGSDLAVNDFSSADLYIFRQSNNWAKSTITVPKRLAGRSADVTNSWNVATVPNSKVDGHDSLLFVNGENTASTTSGLWVLDYVRGKYRSRLVKTFQYNHPVDDLILPADLDGDGVDELIMADSGGNRLMWIGFVPVSLPSDAGARLILTSDRSLANNTVTSWSWDGPEWDVDQYWDTANTERIEIPDRPQFVELIASIRWGQDSTGGRLVRIVKNDSTIICGDRRTASDDSTQNVTTGPIFVEPGDYFTVNVYQNSGGSLNIVAEGSFFAIKPM